MDFLNFLASIDFMVFIVCIIAGLLGGIYIGWRMCQWYYSADRRAAMKSRTPRLIEVPFTGYGATSETLSCDRRRRDPFDLTSPVTVFVGNHEKDRPTQECRTGGHR